MLIARYTANASGVVPVFNEGYQYTVNETSSNGVYTVELYSDTDFTSCSFAMKTGLLTIEYLKVTKNVTSLNSLFANCNSLTSINCSDWDTSNVINMNSVFFYCDALTELDVSNWDTSNVGTLNRAFYCCLNLKSLDLSNWKTTNVTDMNRTFNYCSKMTELNLSGWNVDKVTDTTMTFAYCNKLDTIKLYNCTANTILTLTGSSFFPTEVISGKTRTIYCDEALVGQIGPPTNWVLSSEKESNIKIAEYKFDNTLYDLMPEFYEGFTYTYEDIVEGNVTTRTIYSDSLPIKISFGQGNTEAQPRELSLLGVEYLNITNATKIIYNLFARCQNLQYVNGVNDWDISGISDLTTVFYHCHSLNQLVLSNWDTSNVTNMYCMFRYCKSLTTLDISNFETSNVTNMSYMFDNCNNLTTLNVSNWSLNDSVSTSNLFDYCNNLNSVIMNNSDCVSVNKIISQLPTRTSSSMGTLYVEGVAGSSQINTGDASIKYWNVSIEDAPEEPEYNIIARYTANASGVLPTFNEGYQYEVNETESNGIYTVELSSDEDFTSCMFNGKTNLLTVEYLKVTDKVTTLSLNYYGMFDGCSNLISVNMDGWDTSGLTSMEYAFYDCKKLASLNGINNLNINNVKNMYYLFYNCSSLTQLDLSNWNTKNVTNMGYMFNGCSSLAQLDISNWDTSNVSSLAYFFNNCSKLNQITATNVSTSTLTKLVTVLPTRTSSSYGTINANNTTDELIASANAKYWNIGASVQKQLIAEYKFNNTLYDLIPEFNAEFTDYTYDDIVDGEVTTRTIYSDSLPTMIRFGDTQTDEGVYRDKQKSLLEVTFMDTSALNTMDKMFYKCINVQKIDCDWNTSNVTTMKYMFRNCTNLTSLEVSNWDTGNVTTMVNMFDLCQSLTVLDLSNWNTSKVQNMGAMFGSCYSLSELKTDNWDTSNVTNTSWMFNRNFNLKSLDLSSWNTSKITNMTWMFTDCTGLETLNLNGWNIKNAEYSNMFMPYEYTGCPNLTSILMNNSDYNSVNGIIEQLPTRANDSMGTLNIAGIDDISQVDITTAESKFWNIKNKIKIAEYKFDKSIYENLIPEFNEGFTYTYEDSSIMDGFITRKLYVAENDFVDISKCISRNKGTYNSGTYAGTDIMVSVPMFLNNEILFRGHEWDSLNIDLSDYQGKEINISFTIEHFANQWSELNVGIELYDDTDLDGYSGVIYEDYLSENLIKEYSVTWTIPNEKCRLYLGGMYLELSNINIMIEDYNLFPNHILTEYDYVNTLGFKVNKPSLYDNKLAFSHYWYAFNIECEQFKGKEATISFDIEEIDNSYDYSKCEINIPQTVDIPLNDHYSNTFIIESDHIYIGGNGIKITNLQILVDNRTTEETISNLPTLMRFGTETTSNSALSLLEVNYLDTSNVTDMGNMFRGCSQLTQLDVNNWDTSNVQYMYGMFYDCSQLIQLDLTNWDISSVRDVNGMFVNCSSLTQLDVSTWDTKSVTDMNNTFYNCPLLTSLDLNNWDTKNVTDISGMFWNCSSLTSLDLSNWDTSKVISMSYMFQDCESLTSLDLSNWDLNNITDFTEVFYETPYLHSISMNNSDYNSVNKIIAQLSTRTTDSIGYLYIAGIDDIGQVNTTTAESKFWNIIKESEEPKPETSNLLRIGDTIINNICMGDSQVLKICLGTVLIYEAPFK